MHNSDCTKYRKICANGLLHFNLFFFLNIGIDQGAATLLQDALGRNILFFACRHHIYELYLKCAFAMLVQKSGKNHFILRLTITQLN